MCRRVCRVAVWYSGGQAQSLEPVYEVVREQEEMEVDLVGKEVLGGDASRRILALELPDDQFDPRAVVVQAPEVQRLERQIRDQDLVVVLAKLEERQLVGRLLGLGSADDDEAIWAGPPSRRPPHPWRRPPPGPRPVSSFLTASSAPLGPHKAWRSPRGFWC